MFLISSNIVRSFLCNLIIKTGKTLHLVFNLASGRIPIEKHASASVNPVMNQGFKTFLFIMPAGRVENVL